MKIAFVNQPIGIFAIPPTSSITIGIYELARRLARAGPVIVYALRGRAQPKVEQLEGVEYRRFANVRDRRFLGGLYRRLERLGLLTVPYTSSGYGLDYALQTALDLRRQGCDLVHIPNYVNFVPVIRAFNPRAKIVLHMHCEWLTQFHRATVARSLRQVDLIVGCSAYITEKIRRRFPEFADRCRTVFNGVDPGLFAEPNGHPAAKTGAARRLLFVGRVSPEKGLHVLLEALPLVLARHPCTQLAIVGSTGQLPWDLLMSLGDGISAAGLTTFYDGGSRLSYFEHLQSRARALGIAEHVAFLGPVPQTQLAKHYHDADLVVNPSLSESFGMSLVEAMACGVPVVATRVGGMPEIVDGSGAGVVVEPSDAPALADALHRLLADDGMRQVMGQAGRRQALGRYTWDQIAAQVMREYQGEGGLDEINTELGQ